MLSPFTLTRPTLMRIQVPIGSTIMGPDTQAQNNRDTDQGSAVGGTLQKDTDSSIGELFRNRKGHGSKDDSEPH